MSPRASGRVALCSPAQARSRRQDAEELLSAAQATVGATPESRKASTAISVLAAIAAADAVCGAALGRYSRGQDHRAATDLLQTVSPDGPALASALRRVLSHKDDAHYSPEIIGATTAQQVLRATATLVDAARART